MGNRIVRNLPDGKYKAAVGNVLADGENPFSTESEVKEEVTTTEVVNGLTEGITGSSNDAATQILGSAWRMPTLDEWIELTNTCTMTWTTVEGINGYLVSNNGNSIFLPASGYREETSTYSTGTEGHYWTGSRWSGGVTATFGAFDTTNPSNSGSWIRAYGRSIRPVSNTEGVDLGLSVKWASVNLGATNPQDYGDFFAWGEIETKTDFTYSNYICPSGSYGTENDPMTHVTRPATLTILHKDNHDSHVTIEQKEEWTGKQDQLSQAQIDATNSGITSGKVETYDGYAAGKQDVLGFTPENVANKITDMSNPQAGKYADALTVKNFVANALVGINDYVSSLSTMSTAFEGCSAMSYAPTKLDVGPWYKNGISETANINKGDWAIVLADETVCWFSANNFKYERFKDGGVSPLGYVVLSGGTAVAGTKGTNPCIEIGGNGVVLSYIYPEVAGENTYICFLDNSGAEAITWKVQSLSNTTGAVHKYIGGVEQEDVYDIVFPTTRYICSGHDENNNPVWALLFIVNETSLTAAQWDAINSAITKAWKDGVDVNIAALLLHMANETIHPTSAKQLEWDGKEGQFKRFTVNSTSGYAILDSLNNYDGAYLIITMGTAYGHLGQLGFIYYGMGGTPKSSGPIDAKYNTGAGTLAIELMGAPGSRLQITVIPLNNNGYNGTVTVSGTYAGGNLEKADSIYELVKNKTNDIDSSSTLDEYPSAFAVYNAIKLKTQNFTGSSFSGNIKIAFIPFNSDVILSVERVSGGFGEGIIHIHTNDTTIEKITCDDPFTTYSAYFYLTTGGIVVCYNADLEPYNLTVNIVHDSSRACVLGPTSTLGDQIVVSLTKFESALPITPANPENKFLNANKQWVEIAGGGQTTVYKSVTIENPTASENMCIFYAPVAMTITEIRGVITGATSVSFKVVSGTSRNAVTTEHNSSPVVCSSVTTGNVATITTAAVAAGSWVAVKTSAIVGAPSELVITLSLNY